MIIPWTTPGEGGGVAKANTTCKGHVNMVIYDINLTEVEIQLSESLDIIAGVET